MFYETKDHHGLPHSPFKSLIVPRPIGWVSTISVEGVVNLAPFSFFNGLADSPPMVMISCNGSGVGRERKDTLTNIEETGEFVVNLATEALTDQMNTSSATLPPDVDEIELANLTPVPSRLVKPPRVAESPAHLECTHYQTVPLPANNPDHPNNVVLAHVVGVHIDDSVLTDGMVDTLKFKPLARLGYMEYTVVNNVFTLFRPGMKGSK